MLLNTPRSQTTLISEIMGLEYASHEEPGTLEIASGNADASAALNAAGGA